MQSNPLSVSSFDDAISLEVECLRSIFGDDAVTCSAEGRQVSVTMSGPEGWCLTFTLPHGYPEGAPPTVSSVTGPYCARRPGVGAKLAVVVGGTLAAFEGCPAMLPALQCLHELIIAAAERDKKLNAPTPPHVGRHVWRCGHGDTPQPTPTADAALERLTEAIARNKDMYSTGVSQTLLALRIGALDTVVAMEGAGGVVCVVTDPQTGAVVTCCLQTTAPADVDAVFTPLLQFLEEECAATGCRLEIVPMGKLRLRP